MTNPTEAAKQRACDPETDPLVAALIFYGVSNPRTLAHVVHAHLAKSGHTITRTEER